MMSSLRKIQLDHQYQKQLHAFERAKDFLYFAVNHVAFCMDRVK